MILAAEYRPPAKRGDLLASAREGATVIGLIDGVFHQESAVAHREILAAIKEGVKVIGASSMGALRAAEMDTLGMVGIGKIYRMYRSGELESDDEVALVFDPESGLALSEPLINIRCTLKRALDTRVISPAAHDARPRAARGPAAAARAVDYASTGTVEFLLDADGERFYFLEMNTRLQVEHPVTEWITGLDLVALQLRVARGERLPFGQDDVRLRGHAVEVRLYAEDPASSFFPSAGAILALREPTGPGIRVDSGVRAGFSVPVEYDPLLAKLSAWGADRDAAVRRLLAALRDTAILGPTTNLAFLHDVLAHEAFRRGDTHTGFLAEHLPA